MHSRPAALPQQRGCWQVLPPAAHQQPRHVCQPFPRVLKQPGTLWRPSPHAARRQASRLRSEAAPSAAAPLVTEDVGVNARVCVVLGTQWGDEGKGKLVDILAQKYDIVARAQVSNHCSSGLDLMPDGRGCTPCCTARFILAAIDLACAVFVVVNVAPRAPMLVVPCTVPLLACSHCIWPRASRPADSFRASVQRKDA